MSTVSQRRGAPSASRALRSGAKSAAARGAGTRELAPGLTVKGASAHLWAASPGAHPSALGLASALAEHESGYGSGQDSGSGRRVERVEVVTLCVRRRADAELEGGWLMEIIDWLEGQGRGIVVRTRVRLPREFVLALRGRPVLVELELADLDADRQRALLGPEAARANELLLQAQHLAALGLEVVGRVGPLLPGVHELASMESMLSALRAADLHGVSHYVGELSAPVLERLAACLDAGALMVLTRAFRLPPTAVFALDFDARALSAELAEAIYARFTALVREDAALEAVDPAARQRRSGVAVAGLAPSLFAAEAMGG